MDLTEKFKERAGLAIHATYAGGCAGINSLLRGWHVRRSYTRGVLQELCEVAGLRMNEIGSCPGFISQKLTWLIRRGGKIGRLLGFPLRILPPPIDPLIAKLFRYIDFNVILVACKPCFSG